MNKTRLSPAPLDEAGLTRLRQLEQETGAVIIAYQPESPFAHLSADQVARLKQVERELGVVLLAYDPRETSASA